MAALAGGRPADAVVHLQTVVDAARDPSAPLARFYLARAHQQLARTHYLSKRFDEAARHFYAAGRLSPHGEDLAAHMIECFVKANRIEEAADALERSLAARPDDTRTRVRLAVACARSGEVWKAADLLAQGLSRQPGCAEFHYQLGVIDASRGDLASAVRRFEATIAHDPSHARAFERLAQCCSLEGRHERALRYLERAHQIAPDNARIAWQLAVLAPAFADIAPPLVAPRGRPLDEATLDRLATTLIEEPDFIETFLALPESSVDREVFATLAATLQRALARHPEYADLHYHCGQIYDRLGQAGDAIRHVEEAVAINPRFVNALILLAQLYSQSDRAAEGIERLEAAIRAGGDYPDVHYLIGLLCVDVGEITRARHAFERALALNENYQEARAALAALAA